MNALVKHPALGRRATFEEAEHIVGLMAATLRRAFEDRGAATADDLTRAGFTAAEILEYGEIARARLAKQLFRISLADGLGAASDPDCLAEVPPKKATVDATSPLPGGERDRVRGDHGSAGLPFAVPLAVVEGVGTLSLVAADGEELVRADRTGDLTRAKLEALAECCNSWPGPRRAPRPWRTAGPAPDRETGARQ